MFETNTAARKLALIGKPVPIWMPKMIDSGTPFDDRADNDAHGGTGSRGTEALLDQAVADQEHGDTDQHPEGELPVVEVLGLGDEVEGDGRQQRPRPETGEDPDKGARNCHPADEQPRDQQRALGDQSQSECFENAHA